MTQQKSIENGIGYFAPNHGKHECHTKVPESFNLHVCPSACGRRFAIQALSYGEKDAVSCLYITEADVISGHYEEMIGDAVGEVLTELAHAPKALLLYFNCIDDFLGTDEHALLQKLTRRYPSLRFAVCHVNPVTIDENIKPHMKTLRKIYGLLDYTGKKGNSINLIGNSVSIDAESEFFRVFSDWGINVWQVFDRKTFAEFLQMADSRLNLVISPMGEFAAQGMSEKLDIPYLMNPISFDIDEIEQTYHVLADMLGKKSPGFQKEIEQTKQTIQRAREHVANMPIIVDSTATHLPFGMAKALCRYGFNVKAVFFVRMNDCDWANRKWVESQFPKVSPVRSQNYELIMGAGFERDCMAIGFDGAYTLQAKHFVDIQRDETFYGFHGVRKLMRLICEAYDTTADWEQIKEADLELQRRGLQRS